MPLKLSQSEARRLKLAPKRKRSKITPSEGVWFMAACTAHGLTQPQPEYKFHIDRKWRFDWAWPSYRVALEIEGLNGRHQSIGGFIADMEKYTEAAILNWRVIRVTTRQVETGKVFELLKRAMGGTE